MNISLNLLLFPVNFAPAPIYLIWQRFIENHGITFILN